MNRTDAARRALACLDLTSLNDDDTDERIEYSFLKKRKRDNVDREAKIFFFSFLIFVLRKQIVFVFAYTLRSFFFFFQMQFKSCSTFGRKIWIKQFLLMSRSPSFGRFSSNI